MRITRLLASRAPRPSDTRGMRGNAGSLGLVPLGIGLVVSLLMQGTASAAEPVSTLVRKAVAQYAADNRGDLAFSRHLAFSLHVGPMAHDVRNEIGVLMHDGAYMRVRYYSAATNGKTEDDSELRRQEETANGDLAGGRGFFKRPVDPHYTADYRFDSAACAECTAGEVAVAFTSLVHDRQHGSGTMVLDETTGRVHSIAYTYDRPPEHASAADGVETFGEAIPGLWTCLHVQETYHGHLGLIGGTASLTYTLDHFRRFAQLDAALAALDAHSL
jgi:hypothetical protein